MACARTRFLFIRILEACNADCFMCDFALSKDPYRFDVAEFEALLPAACSAGVGHVRLTGGEPLMHRNIIDLVRAGSAAGMAISIITNGSLLPKMAGDLVEAGLSQIIVSIDGASPATHDDFRNTPGLFDKCVNGLRIARRLGIQTRVNTVVGPHNYREMRDLQSALTEIGVEQWELSAIKLGRAISYDSPDAVRRACEPIYTADPHRVLVPLGKRFYGETAEEQARFFSTGVTPRPSGSHCNLVGEAIYLEPKSGRGFGCSLLPHRDEDESGGGTLLRSAAGWAFDTPAFQRHIEHFRACGPRICTSCSTTAAGYSDAVAAGRPLPEPAF